MAVVEANYRVQQAGSFEFCATATSGDGLSARSCATTVVAAGQVSLRITGPDAAAVGSQAQFELEVVNQSDAPAVGLTVSDRFDPGLEHTNVNSNVIVRELPEIAPNSSYRMTVTFNVTRAGQLCHEATVTGAGVRSSVRKCITATGGAAPPVAPSTPAVPPVKAPDNTPPAEPENPPSQPDTTSISVRKTGPTQRRVNEVAEFKIEIVNTGTTTLQNVRVADNYDEPSIEPQAATDGYDASGGALTWRYKSLAPGKTIRLVVNCKCVQEATRACNRVTVTADGGISQAAEACLEILADGAPATPPPAAPPAASPPVIAPPAAATVTPGNLDLSIVDDVDPVRVGGDVVYSLTLTNRSRDSDRQVQVTAQLPDGVSLKGIKIPGRSNQSTLDGKILHFPPVAELRAGESVTYEIKVHAENAGTVTIYADTSSQRVTDPVSAETTTVITQ